VRNRVEMVNKGSGSLEGLEEDQDARYSNRNYSNPSPAEDK
jgi:hypothetical protein